MFKRWGFQTQMVVIAILASLIVATVGFTGVYYMNKAVSILEHTVEQIVPKFIAVEKAVDKYNGVVNKINSAFAQRGELDTYRAQLESVGKEIKELQDVIKEYDSNPFMPNEQQQYEPLKNHLLQIISKAREIQEYDVTKIDQALSYWYSSELIQLRIKINNELDDLFEFHIKATEKIETTEHHLSNIGITVVLAISLSGIVLVLVLFLLFSKRVSNKLKRIVTGLTNSTVEVKGASFEVASGADRVSKASTEQASSIEETSASLEEISGMVLNNLEQAQEAMNLSNAATAIAKEAETTMERLNASMEGILNSNKMIEKMVEIIGNIADKTDVMNEIVFQTKLLSFNASVEAERAGEHGRGFAVVAQEVGNLAQMSGKSAAEIEQIVQKSTAQAKEVYSETKAKVEEGGQAVSETVTVLNEITANITKITNASSQVVTASQEQSSGIKQINDAIMQLDRIIQENASTAEENADSAHELSAQSHNLEESVNEMTAFLYGEKGKAASTVSSVKATKVKKEEKKIIAPTKIKNTPTKSATAKKVEPEQKSKPMSAPDKKKEPLNLQHHKFDKKPLEAKPAQIEVKSPEKKTVQTEVKPLEKKLMKSEDAHKVSVQEVKKVEETKDQKKALDIKRKTKPDSSATPLAPRNNDLKSSHTTSPKVDLIKKGEEDDEWQDL